MPAITRLPCEDALEAVRLMPAEPPTTDLANVHAHAAGLLLFAGRLSAAEAEARQALTTAQAVGARPEEAVALGVLGWIEVVRGEPDRGVELVREAWRIARSLGHVTGLAVAYNHLAAVLDLAGRVRESLDVAREGIAEADRLGTARSFGAQLEGNAAHALLRLGRWDESEAMTDSALARGAAPGPLTWLRIVRARLDAARGRFASADGELRALDAAADPVSIAPYVGWWYVARAEVAFWQDDPATALDAGAGGLRRPAPAGHRRLRRVSRRTRPRCRRGRRRVGATRLARARSRARAAAEPIRDRVRRLHRSGLLAPPDMPTAGRSPGSGRADGEGRARRGGSRASQLAVRSPPSWRRLIAAAEVEEQAPLVAYGRYRLAAAMLASQGDREQVARVLRDAHALAVELGAVPLTARIETLARRARIVLRSTADAGGGGEQAFGLTERERDVLALIVAGKSNREIGEALFISPKTASVHVSNILAKMEVDGRVEAATMALRMGIVAARGLGRRCLDEGLTVSRRPALESAIAGR